MELILDGAHFMEKKVIVAEPDEDFAQKLKTRFLESNIDCTVAHVGKDAQLLIAKNEYNAVILNHDLQNFTATEVLSYIKSTNPFMRVFMVFNNAKVLEDTKIESKKKQLGITDVFIKDKDIERLIKNVLSNEASKIWKELDQIKMNNSLNDLSKEEMVVEDAEFFPFKIEMLKNCESAVFDTFIRLSAGRYVLLVRQGENLATERFIRYYKSEVGLLYYRCADRMELLQNLSKQLAEMKADDAIKEPVEIANIIANSQEFMLQELVTNGFHNDRVRIAEGIITDTLSLLKSVPSLENQMMLVFREKDEILAHGMMSSLITSLISQNLDWVSSKLSTEFAFAALIQNIGNIKTGINSLELENDASENQKKIFESHPIVAYRFLQHFPVSEKIRQIVLQHHEFCDGSGFPLGLKCGYIFPPAKIVAMASVLSQIVLSQKTSVKGALEIMIRSAPSRVKYDPEVIKALIKALIKKK